MEHRNYIAGWWVTVAGQGVEFHIDHGVASSAVDKWKKFVAAGCPVSLFRGFDVKVEDAS